VIGRGIYQPGWRWSEHARARTGKQSEAHTGLVITGRLAIQAPDGMVTVVGPGEAFFAPTGHDAWVVGDEPCVALDFAPSACG
jgi:quercetin dioxygenase-like cupin family protein